MVIFSAGRFTAPIHQRSPRFNVSFGVTSQSSSAKPEKKLAVVLRIGFPTRIVALLTSPAKKSCSGDAPVKALIPPVPKLMRPAAEVFIHPLERL